MVDGILAQEVVVGVETAHPSLVEHEDAVAVFHAGDTLRDDDLGDVGQVFSESTLDSGIGGGVAGTGAVVEDKHLGMFEQCPGDAQTLLLSAGDVHAALLDARVIAVGHLFDELVGAGHPAGVLAFLEGGLAVAPPQVVEDGAREEHVLLQHHGHSIAEGLEVVLPHVLATNHHTAFRHVIEATDKVDDRRLTATRTTNHTDGLAALHME